MKSNILTTGENGHSISLKDRMIQLGIALQKTNEQRDQMATQVKLVSEQRDMYKREVEFLRRTIGHLSLGKGKEMDTRLGMEKSGDEFYDNLEGSVQSCESNGVEHGSGSLYVEAGPGMVGDPVRVDKLNLQELSIGCKAIRSDLEVLKDSSRQYSFDTGILFSQLKEICEKTIIAQSEKILSMKEDNIRIRDRLRSEKGVKIRLYNELSEEKGQIRVNLRIRPTSDVTCIKEIEDDGVITLLNDKSFQFDRIYPLNSSQKDVFGDVLPLLSNFSQGCNSVVMAFGETSSGKTWTMHGSEKEAGIVSRSIDYLANHDYDLADVTVSMIEVYNERIRDLFSTLDDNYLDFVDTGKDVIIKDLVVFKETNPDNLKKSIALGMKRRTTIKTNMNSSSSRSHCIISFELNKKGKHSKFLFVDLAGSENFEMSGVNNGDQKDHMREASNVNKSLLALQEVMKAIRLDKTYIPYRGSKLTQLMRHSFENSKMIMIVHASNSQKQMAETSHSLEFGSESREIRTFQSPFKSPVSRQLLMK